MVLISLLTNVEHYFIFAIHIVSLVSIQTHMLFFSLVVILEFGGLYVFYAQVLFNKAISIYFLSVSGLGLYSQHSL